MNQMLLKRKSHIIQGEIYFVTSTIHKWQVLLEKDEYKDIIVGSMAHLCQLKKWEIFAFVIMPNHIHMILRTLDMNGKETPQSSFLKFTAHEFKKKLKQENINSLQKFSVNAANKKFEFWQRDSLAIILYTNKVAYQKLDYIHYNPLNGKWSLAKDPSEYYYSSASFYESGFSPFSFLSDLRDEF